MAYEQKQKILEMLPPQILIFMLQASFVPILKLLPHLAQFLEGVRMNKQIEKLLLACYYPNEIHTAALPNACIAIRLLGWGGGKMGTVEKIL